MKVTKYKKSYLDISPDVSISTMWRSRHFFRAATAMALMHCAGAERTAANLSRASTLSFIAKALNMMGRHHENIRDF